MDNPAIDAGFGLVLIVVFISLILFGIVLSQGMTYYANFPRDRTWMKVFVGYILVLDLLSTIEACAWPYHVLVVNWGDPSAIMSSSWILALNPACIGLMAFSVQTFLAWRLYKVTHSLVLTALVCAGAVTAFVNAIGTCVWASLARSFSDYPTLKPMGSVWLASSVVTDIVLTAALSYALAKKKGRFAETNNIVDRIIRVSVQNGLLTTVVALSDLILFIRLGSPSHTVSFVLPKLYSNTVLLSLNSRSALRSGDGSYALQSVPEHSSHAHTDISAQSRRAMPSRSDSHTRSELAIRVDTTRSEVTDEHKTADWAASRLGAQVIEDIDAEAMSKSASLGRGL